MHPVRDFRTVRKRRPPGLAHPGTVIATVALTVFGPRAQNPFNTPTGVS